jgi:methionine-S-sulfoxide reductase
MTRPPVFAALLVVALAALAARCAGAPETAPLPPVGAAIDPATADTVVFAGGCFWCMEKPFEQLPGVGSVVSGFAGGTVPNPTYDQVSTKTTGHYEVVQIVYDPAQVSYETLLRAFWHNIDPFQADGQFCDRGSPYRSAVFAGSAEERALAEASRAEIAARFGRQVATEVLPDAPFYAAEAYHQDFYRTNPTRYQSYRAGCGRDARLAAIWGPAAGIPSDSL